MFARECEGERGPVLVIVRLTPGVLAPRLLFTSLSTVLIPPPIGPSGLEIPMAIQAYSQTMYEGVQYWTSQPNSTQYQFISRLLNTTVSAYRKMRMKRGTATLKRDESEYLGVATYT